MIEFEHTTHIGGSVSETPDGRIVVTANVPVHDVPVARVPAHILARYSPEQKASLADTYLKHGFDPDTVAERFGTDGQIEPGPAHNPTIDAPASANGYHIRYSADMTETLRPEELRARNAEIIRFPAD